jgi:predicted dehydrogenase
VGDDQPHPAPRSPTKDFFSGGVRVPSPWEPTIAQPDPSTWQVKEHGGGYGYGQITHSSALLHWLTGLRAAEVTARMTAPNSRVDMYDAATVAFGNGAIGVVSGAATLPDDDGFQIDLRVFGDQGVLLLDVERERLDVRRHDGRHAHVEVPRGEGAYSCEGPPNHFVELIAAGGTNSSPGEVAARSVELIDAMYRSAADGGAPTRVHGTEEEGAAATPRVNRGRDRVGRRWPRRRRGTGLKTPAGCRRSTRPPV